MQPSRAAPSGSKRSPIRRRSIQKPSRPRFDCWPETSSTAHWCRRCHRERAMRHETSADAALNQEAASPACVLVVDDTIANLRLLSNMLSEEGCLLYTSDAADERSSVDLGGRRIIK